jgi:osmoprotectant transport system ATP-binding protein
MERAAAGRDGGRMIRLENVSKTFPGTARPAVDGLDLDVPGGTTCVLIGPSGCGKTTTMRIVNRLIEPDQGRIVVEGEDVTRSDAVELRRRIGYVIQQVGLFPHMTIAQNVATVPQLLGWPQERIARRVEEMLSLVGLEPAQFLARHPRHLSGGQRQRVGVARALAADPPVLLMDEPFGAVDPIVRAGLQAELLGILRRLAKTVIFVTHDIDEAIRMGDLIAIMKDGRLVQCAAPEELLAAPKDSFVADFVGSDRALKRLTLTTAGEAARPGAAPAPGAPNVAAGTSLRDVLSLLLQSGADLANVADANGGSIGTVSLATIRDHAAAPVRRPD